MKLFPLRLLFTFVLSFDRLDELLLEVSVPVNKPSFNRPTYHNHIQLPQLTPMDQRFQHSETQPLSNTSAKDERPIPLQCDVPGYESGVQPPSIQSREKTSHLSFDYSFRNSFDNQVTRPLESLHFWRSTCLSLSSG